MSKFKVGDIVQCVSIERGYENKPIIGKKYKISYISEGWIHLEHLDGSRADCFYPKDFILVSEFNNKLEQELHDLQTMGYRE